MEELVFLPSVNLCTYVATIKYLEIQSADQVYQFLLSLNETYHQLHSQILAIDLIPPLAHCYSIIHQEKTQLLVSISTAKTDTMTFLSQAPNHKSTLKQQPKRVWPLGSPIYSDCKKSGHTRDCCLVEIDYPELWPTKPKESLTSSNPMVHNVTASSMVSSTSVVPRLSHEQYGHLLELLQPPTLVFSGLSPCALNQLHLSLG